MNEPEGDSLLDIVPVMDYDQLGVIPTDLPSSAVVTALAGCSQYMAVGTSVGTVHIIDLSSNELRTVNIKARSAIVGISIELGADFFVAISGESGEVFLVSSDLSVRDLKPEIDFSFLPLTAAAICPYYSQSGGHNRRIVIGGSSGDLLVLSQQGPPYAKTSVSKTNSKGPLVAVDWRDNVLVWAGAEFGVKALNTESGAKIGHFEIKSSHGISVVYVGNHQWLVNYGFKIVLLEIGLECIVRLSVELPSTKFTPNSEIGRLITNRERIVGVCQFDDNEHSLSVVSVASGGKEINHHIVDTVKNDIPVTDLVPFKSEKAPKSVEFKYVAGSSPFLLIGIDRQVWKAEKRSLAANAMFLVERGMYEEALALSHSIKDQTTRTAIAKRVVSPLVNAKQFDRVVTLIPSLEVDWSEFIDLFISFEVGGTLASAMKALVPSVPYSPRDGHPLSPQEYEKVIQTLIRNIELNYFELLEAVRKWPPTAFDSKGLKDRLIDIVDESLVLDKAAKDVFVPTTTAAFPPKDLPLSRTSKQVSLLLVLKKLYENLGKLADALDVLLKLLCYGEVFSILRAGDILITNSSVRSWFEVNMLSLFQADAVGASNVLISHSSVFPLKSVLSELESHPFFFHVFLREMFLLNPESTKQNHDRQVDLFSQFDRKLLVKFLREASGYDPSEALKVVRASATKYKELIEAEAVLLWKCGKFQEAINLLLNESEDITTAVKFGSTVSDPNLWTSIQSYVLKKGGAVLSQYVEALTDVDSEPAGFSAANAILLSDGENIENSFAVPIHKVITNQELTHRILQACETIVRGDYERMRSGAKPWNFAIAVSPKTLCRICGCSVVNLPPGLADEDQTVLDNTIAGLPFHTKTDSVLAVISGHETVHSRCLMRTVADDSSGT